MTDNLDLVGEIQQKMNELDISLKHLRKTGCAAAEAERAYKIALRHKALQLKDSGMAIGMINLTIHGEPEVADLRFERDKAETIHKANTEAVNVLKLQLRIMTEQLNREWGNIHD